jgi:hypothetical protein
MKSKTLTQTEVKKRINKTLAGIFSTLFGMSKEEANKKLRTALEADMQDPNGLLQAALVHTLTQNILKGRGRRCTEEELEIVLTKLRASAPEMSAALRKGLKAMQKNLPRRGGPGRAGILSATEKREACDQISALYKIGRLVRWADIFEAVAETFRTRGKTVSARTIKRAWEERQSLYVG